MQVDYTVQVWREDGQFIAHAMPLDVASAGDSPEGARLAVDEAVKLFLRTAAEHGTLDEVHGRCRLPVRSSGMAWSRLARGRTALLSRRRMTGHAEVRPGALAHG